MSQSLNNSIDSFIDSFFSKNDFQNVSRDDDSLDTATAVNPYQDSFSTKRSNLMVLFKLVIKELFKRRTKGTITAECRTYFEHLFALLEQSLQHGLKQRKQIFGSKVDVWSVIEVIGKHWPEAGDSIESVRHLSQLRTPLAKTRAWLRVAMMKKKLADCFQVLINLRETVMREYYDPHSLMMTDDGNLLAGLLVGLNSFDYYVYVKDDTFDYEPVVDLRYYLKEDDQDSLLNGGSVEENKNNEHETISVEVLAEQNSYVEEINKQLQTQIKHLESKLETLATESRMRNSLDNSQQNCRSLMEFGTVLANKEKQIIEEETLRRDVEKRLECEVKLRQECETARDLLERDIQEKQDMMRTLRTQLEEVKAMNIQIFSKLQEKDRELKEKNSSLANCETQATQLKKEIAKLEKRLGQPNENNSNTIDKELLANYQKLIDEQQEQMTQMQLEIEDLKIKSSYNVNLKEAYSLLKKKFDENELALEEVGKQLHDAKLDIESLKEYNGHLKEAAWAKDSEARKCKQCDREFTLARRRHHCRSCGEIFCAQCSNSEMPLPSSKKPVRVCDSCHAFLLDRYSHSS